MQIHSKLEEAIKDDKLIIFVGSGFSMPLGIPNWSGLIKEILLDLSKDDPNYNSLIDILDKKFFSEIEILEKIKDKKNEIYEVLDKLIENVSLEEGNLKLHKLLGDLSTKIITTNYDKALETANNYQKITFKNIFHIAKMPKKSNYIFKLHGCIEDPSECILFQDDYERLYKTENAAIDMLRTLIKDHTILFVGFSLSDPYVRQQFEFIHEVYQGFTNKHFIITVDDFPYNSLGVDTIKINDWSFLEETLNFLLDIKKDTSNSKSSSEILNTFSDQKNPLITTTEICRIALLISCPLNEDAYIYNNFGNIKKLFSNFNISIDCYYFSVETLRNLEGYNYILIFSKVIKNKIIVEDHYLRSELLSLKEIEDNIIISNIKGVFILLDKSPMNDTGEITLPIALSWGQDLRSFVFKVFQKNTLENIDNSEIFNKEKFNLVKLSRGHANVKMVHEESILSENIDEKNLINFVGRKTDLEDVIRKVLDINKQVLTLKGSGGIGKTTLIKKVAIELHNRGLFYQGIHFIDCEFISDYQKFEYKVTQCFDIDSSINLKEHISDNKMKLETLIIFDNFESLLYLEQVDEIKNLVTFICDYSSIVVTSREWIGFEFETRHELRAFTTDEAYALFRKYYTSVIVEDDVKILKEDILSKLLNNNPLAIKIITKNLPKTKRMNELKHELEADFFNIIETGYKDIFDKMADDNIERSQSLYQSISYSYKKLTPKEKLLFEILSLFPDGIHMNNIKTFFQRDDFKLDLNKITDKEIIALENKSLIEINKGFIKLQSILGRFAEYEFVKRTEKEKEDYYKRAFELNHYLLTQLFEMDVESYVIRIFDQNLENILKCLDFISLFSFNKYEKLEFIDKASHFFQSILHTTQLCLKIQKNINHFDDIENADILLNATILVSEYYYGDFEIAYDKFLKLIPLEDVYNLNFHDRVERRILLSAISVYKYRNNAGIKKYYFKIGIKNQGLLLDFLFHAGEYLQFSDEYTESSNCTFYYFETLLNTNKLGKVELEIYIKSLYKKQYIEIMQTNYIKSKMCDNNKKNINGLVVTNPYTFGLKNLMLAFLERNTEKAKSLYLLSINSLEHIRYYHTEAIFYYAKFLKELDDPETLIWINKGTDLAIANEYKFLIHQFKCLSSGINEEYNEMNYYIPDEIIERKLIIN